MATYCMADGQQYTLFAECAVRGWLAAILDYPHVKREEECIPLATALQHEIEHETCCISDKRAEFQDVVNTAFIKSYLALSEASEREIVVMVSVLKRMSTDEALALLRHGMKEKGEQIDAFYGRYLAARTHTVSEK